MFSGMVIPEPLHDPYYAIGSGWEFALSCLALGGTAQDAVRFAAQHDVYTGGEIIIAELKNDQEEEPPKARPRTRAKKQA